MSKQSVIRQPDVGVMVATTRKLRGLSRERLAARAEVSAMTVRRIERAEVQPQPSTLAAIVAALDADVLDRRGQNDRERPAEAPPEKVSITVAQGQG